MHKRTLVVLLGTIVLLALGVLGCSVTSFVARAPAVTVTPTRTPRPTWTPASGGFQVATPTIDATRFPAAALTSQAAGSAVSTAQVFVPGGNGPIFVPVGPGGGWRADGCRRDRHRHAAAAANVHARPAHLAAAADVHARPTHRDADQHRHAAAAGDGQGEGRQVERSPGSRLCLPGRHAPGSGHECDGGRPQSSRATGGRSAA